jgi:hypothetical protein
MLVIKLHIKLWLKGIKTSKKSKKVGRQGSGIRLPGKKGSAIYLSGK